MTDYLFLVLAAAMLAIDFAISKLYQSRAGTGLTAGFAFNALLGLFTAVLFFAIGGFTFPVSGYSVWMAFLISALSMTYTLVGFRILRAGSMALYSLFLMTGGMALPYVWGLLFLDEPFSWVRTAGLLLLICAVALSNLPSKKNRLNLWLLLGCVAVFILNGFVSVVSKLHQINTEYLSVDTTHFVMLGGICKCFLSGIAYLCATFYKHQKAKTIPKTPLSRSLLPLIALSAVIGGVSYLLQLIGAKNLPATVLYPFITGGSMICSSIVGIVCFKEKISRRLAFCILLCFMGTLLFL